MPYIHIINYIDSPPIFVFWFPNLFEMTLEAGDTPNNIYITLELDISHDTVDKASIEVKRAFDIINKARLKRNLGPYWRWSQHSKIGFIYVTKVALDFPEEDMLMIVHMHDVFPSWLDIWTLLFNSLNFIAAHGRYTSYYPISIFGKKPWHHGETYLQTFSVCSFVFLLYLCHWLSSFWS